MNDHIGKNLRSIKFWYQNFYIYLDQEAQSFPNNSISKGTYESPVELVEKVDETYPVLIKRYVFNAF